MNQTREKSTIQPATTRAEALFNRMGKGLGVFAASTSQRVQDAASTVREKTVRADHAKAASSPTHESDEAIMARADELVSRMEVRMSYVTSLVGLKLQKTAARLREEAEDMWAEAQHIRHQNRRKPQ